MRVRRGMGSIFAMARLALMNTDLEALGLQTIGKDE